MYYEVKIAGRVANNVDLDQMLQNVTSDLGLHCLLKPVCLNTWEKYGYLIKWNHAPQSLLNNPGSPLCSQFA